MHVREVPCCCSYWLLPLKPAGYVPFHLQTPRPAHKVLGCAPAGSADSDNIMALALSFNKKHLAVAEHGEKVSVSIYDLQTLKRRKVLVSADPGTKVRRLHQQGPLYTCRHRAICLNP